MLKIWGRRSAFNVQKVLWFLDELELAHEHIDAGGSAGGLDRPDFLAMNPHGRIPVIDDGGTVVWESQAILRYLAATHGAERFWPASPAERAPADAWMDWSQTRLQPDFLTGIFWGYYRTPEPQRDTVAIAAAIDQTSADFARIEQQLEGRDFLLGDSLSLADIPVGTHLYRYFSMDLPRPALPNLEAWYARLCERPAYASNVMLPFDNLKGRLDY